MFRTNVSPETKASVSSFLLGWISLLPIRNHFYEEGDLQNKLEIFFMLHKCSHSHS